MKELTLKNKSMTRLLLNITNLVFNEDTTTKLNGIAREHLDDQIKLLIPNLVKFTNDKNGLIGHQDDFLFEAMKYNLNLFGFPPCQYFVGTSLNKEDRFRENSNNFLWDLIGNSVTKIMTFLGSYENALVAYYPNNGYIGWHHNGNASGYNILLSYSTDGNGYFKYFDRSSNRVVYMHDKPGWNLKVGYFPSEVKEPSRVYWHAAATVNPRLSIAFVFPKKELWVNMIEDLTGNDFNRDEVLGQGPQNG